MIEPECIYCGMKLPSWVTFHDIKSCAEYLKTRAEKAEAEIKITDERINEVIEKLERIHRQDLIDILCPPESVTK